MELVRRPRWNSKKTTPGKSAGYSAATSGVSWWPSAGEDVNALMGEGRLSVLDIEPVSSLSGLEDYWLLTLGDGRQPIGQALVSETGWLLSAMRFSADVEIALPTREWARAVAESLGYSGASIRRTHLSADPLSMPGVSDYRPLFEVSAGDGNILFLSDSGSAYVPDPTGQTTADGRRFRKIR